MPIRGPRNLPQPHLVLLYQPFHVWSAHRFPPLLFVYVPSHDPTLDNEFMPISSSISTPTKSCAAAFLSASFVFVTPKVFPLPIGLWPVYPCSPGGLVIFVRFFIMEELGAAAVCILVLISSTVRPSEFSPILSWSEERGEASERLYVYVLPWFLYTAEATLYLSLRWLCWSPNNCKLVVHGAWVVRSYVLLTKTRVVGNERKVRMRFSVRGKSSPCPGSWVSSK